MRTGMTGRGVGVPPGGGTGQLLAKTSTTDYATAWNDPPLNLTAGMLPPGPGQWALATMLGNDVATSVAPALGIPEGMAMPLNRTGTFDAVGWYMGGGGVNTQTIRVTIYDADPVTQKPKNTVRELGTLVLGSGPTSRTFTFPALTLPSALYWLIFVVQGSGTLPTILNAAGGTPYVFTDGTALNTDYGRWLFPSVPSGPLPNPMTNPDSSATNGRRFHLRGA